MMPIKMWLARTIPAGDPISIRPKHEQAEADAKRLCIPKFEVLPVMVEFTEISMEEIINGRLNNKLDNS
jgi:hypothetical protein